MKKLPLIHFRVRDDVWSHINNKIEYDISDEISTDVDKGISRTIYDILGRLTNRQIKGAIYELRT